MTESDGGNSEGKQTEQLQILLVSHLFPPDTGGVQQVAENLAVHSDHEIDVLAPSIEDRNWDERYPFDVFRYPITGVFGIFFQLLLLLRYLPKYDTVYFARTEYAFLAFPWRIANKPVFAHAHGSELYSNGSKLHEFYLTFSLRTVDTYIAISEWTERRLSELGIPLENIHQIPNGVKFDRFHDPDTDIVDWPFDSDSYVVLTVGRVVPRKGHRHVIRALPKLDEDVQYCVVGPGETEHLEQIADSENVSDRVHILGKVSERSLPGVYALADVFVMPSDFVKGDVESFGLVYLEANAAGTPVIGSRIGGIPSAIKHGETGLLCDPNPESVADSISTVLSDPRLGAELSRNGIEWARSHDWSHIVDKWDTTVHDLCSD